ncbi:MAG: diacylglycerol kinase family protein [Anaerolineaceae bacterium]|nr:diacylglycerol kinase family protein [Anaerolineaceae bacterium]
MIMLAGEYFKSRALSFKNAFSGLAYVLRTQRNAWIHLVFTASVIILGVFLKVTGYGWALIIFAFGIVWIAEILNTALEVLVDLASPEKHPLAKICKDVGAAAVLIAALTSVAIGLCVLGPPLASKISVVFQ